MKELSNFEWLAPGQRSKTIKKINLIARGGSAEDIPRCYALHRSLGLPYTSAAWRALPDMWRAILSNGTMKLFLVEDRARPLDSRVILFSAIVFVNDEFCSEARSTLPPYLSVHLARQYLLHQLPVLNREQVASANAGDGLNVVMCFEGRDCDDLSTEQVLVLREKQSKALRLVLSGYRVKEFLADAVGRETAQWMLDGGAHVRRNYPKDFRKHAVPISKSRRHPLLLGLTKAEAVAHPGSNLAALFAHTRPRFHFSRSERMLLQQALMGQTCEQLAASLSLSPWTVKKRWQAIYDRVTDVDSTLLPSPIAYSAHASSRGAERRRHLLNYLRQHLEELRPYQLPSPRYVP